MDLTRERIESWRAFFSDVEPEDSPELNALCGLALRGLEGRWRPIETAPKGERVILFCGSLNGEKEVIASNIGRDPEFPWHCDDTSRIAHDVPTRWLPLPAPPEGK
jgi:hypothetical protein